MVSTVTVMNGITLNPVKPPVARHHDAASDVRKAWRRGGPVRPMIKAGVRRIAWMRSASASVRKESAPSRKSRAGNIPWVIQAPVRISMRAVQRTAAIVTDAPAPITRG